MSVSNPHAFREEALFQRNCAVCHASGGHHAHHVVSKQRLKREGLVHKLWDPRNALRLCVRCHCEFEACNLIIETSELTDDNICFIWDALGVAGENLLERVYSGVDRRFTRHYEDCERCQLPS